MERLTEKQDGEYRLYCGEENSLCVSSSSIDNSLSDFRIKNPPHITFVTGSAINKLGKLEDILESFCIEDLDEFIDEQLMEHKALDDEVYKLKQELAELKQKAIVPKFQVGQECWGVVPPSGLGKKGYIIHFKVRAYIPDNNGILLMLEDNITSLHYSYEHQVFTTREEAEQKLAEIRRKDG